VVTGWTEQGQELFWRQGLRKPLPKSYVRSELAFPGFLTAGEAIADWAANGQEWGGGEAGDWLQQVQGKP